MKTASVALLSVAALGFSCASQADYYGLGGNLWGNVSAPGGWYNLDTNTFGTLPGPSDDAQAGTACVGGYSVGQPPCDYTYMEDTSGNPVQATLRSFDGVGRWLYIGTGASLQATYDSNASGINMTGGQLTTFSTFTVGWTQINWGGVVNPSMLTGPGEFILTHDTNVEGSLQLMGSGRVTNQGTVVQRNAEGNISLWFDEDFYNQGTVDIQNDNGIAVQSPNQDHVSPIEFHNETGATLMKSAGTGNSVIEAPIINAGLISVTSGSMTLAGGGVHNDGAEWQTAGTAALILLGDHTIHGTVNNSGSGSVWIGNYPDRGSLTVAGDGTLNNSGNLFQTDTMSVASGGQVHNTGAFYNFANLDIAAGGHFLNDTFGSVQVAGTITNHGDLTNNSGTMQLTNGEIINDGGTVTLGSGGGIFGDGTYTQRGNGSTLIGYGATVALSDTSSFVQEDGVTDVNGSLAAGTLHFMGGTLNGNGTITGNVQIDPGVTLGPGNTPGQLTIDGNLFATDTLFDIEVAGTDAGVSYDQLLVTGDALFTGGNVHINFINGFLPTVGDSFEWLVVYGMLDGLDSLNLFVTSNAGSVSGYLNGGLFIVDSVTPSAVPVPASVWLLVSGLLGLVGVARRKAA